MIRLCRCAAVFPAFVFAILSAAPFPAGRFETVVNRVELVAADASVSPAKEGGPFATGELVKTGRASRSQILLEDGTLVRVGPNAVFTLDRDSRTVNLKRGAVLLHVPKGKGGGSVVTNSATASVVGTTIVVSLDDSGAYECLVLEGECDAKWKTKTFRVTAGGLARKAAPGAGTPAELAEFDLRAYVSKTVLCTGFSTKLPSQAQVDAAISARPVSGREKAPSACSLGEG